MQARDCTEVEMHAQGAQALRDVPQEGHPLGAQTLGDMSRCWPAAPGRWKISRALAPLCAGVREMRSFPVAHEDIKFNALMPRNYHIRETLINLRLPPWVLLSSLLAGPPPPCLLLPAHVELSPPHFCLPPLLPSRCPQGSSAKAASSETGAEL